jgi:hypothetical protein
MTQYAYVITGSWSRRAGALSTNTMTGTFDIDPDQTSITYREAYEKISGEFAKSRGLAPGEFAVLFFSLHRNETL